jgi:hypothetical protein
LELLSVRSDGRPRPRKKSNIRLRFDERSKLISKTFLSFCINEKKATDWNFFKHALKIKIKQTACKEPFIGDCRVSKKTRSSSVKNGD